MARDTLATLIRLGKFEVDEKRRALQEILDLEQALRDEIAALEAEERAEQQFVSTHAEQSATYGSYSVANKKRREVLLHKIADMIPEIEEARSALSEAFAVQKRYEIAKENQDAAQNAVTAKREREEMDELALQAHRREMQ